MGSQGRSPRQGLGAVAPQLAPARMPGVYAQGLCTMQSQPSIHSLSPGKGVWVFGKDAEIRTRRALHEAKPSECPKGDRDSKLEVCFNNILFLQAEILYQCGRSENMNSEELGKRIKEARLAKKMTQSELVGTFITRNMLSRIESGNACPSVKTLEYLAGRLDLPAGSLISDEVQGEEDPDRNAQQLITVKRLYKESDYSACIKAAEKLNGSEFEDEGQAITARCCIALSEKAMNSCDKAAAIKYAKQALELADKGIYKSREISVDATLKLSEIAGGK